jgi:hypothetical protein
VWPIWLALVFAFFLISWNFPSPFVRLPCPVFPSSRFPVSTPFFLASPRLASHPDNPGRTSARCPTSFVLSVFALLEDGSISLRLYLVVAGTITRREGYMHCTNGIGVVIEARL